MNLSKISAVTAEKTRTTGISPFSELEISKVYPNPKYADVYLNNTLRFLKERI